MAQVKPAQLTMVPLFNGEEAAQGPKCIMASLDMSAIGSWDFDYTQQQRDGTLEFLQCLWIDNADNAAVLTVTFANESRQRIKVKANSQGYYPVLCGSEIKFNILTTPAASLIVPIGVISGDIAGSVWQSL